MDLPCEVIKLIKGACQKIKVDLSGEVRVCLLPAATANATVTPKKKVKGARAVGPRRAKCPPHPVGRVWRGSKQPLKYLAESSIAGLYHFNYEPLECAVPLEHH